MIQNRRNYYRILYLQPEAPPEVIKASWRALMHAARMHPDLGGDPVRAALINQAYAVLSDPERRRAYDRLLDVTRLRAPGGAAGTAGPSAASGTGPRPPGPRSDPASWRIERCCPMCRNALPAALRADTRCGRCDAPLAPAPDALAGERELFGRRSSARRARGDLVAVHADWRGRGVAARLIDLSFGGASLVCSAPAAQGQAVRVITHGLDAVARVVACHRVRDDWRLRVQWLTTRALGPRGAYVSVSA
jgi:curved DNA-binding protein CbpA